MKVPSTPPSVPSAPPLPASPVTGIPLNHHRCSFPPPPASSDLGSLSPVPWSTGLCDCYHNVGICCLTCWCPCITFGRIAEIVDRGSTTCGISGALYSMILCVSGCACMYSCFYRSKLRGQYNLAESPCTDCCVHCCCEPCALCQEYRELQYHGLDLSIGTAIRRNWVAWEHRDAEKKSFHGPPCSRGHEEVDGTIGIIDVQCGCSN